MKKNIFFISAVVFIAVAGALLIWDISSTDFSFFPFLPLPVKPAFKDTPQEADKFVASLMEARIEGNRELAEKFLSDEAKTQYATPPNMLIGPKSPYFSDFGVLEKKETKPGEYFYKLRIINSKEDRIVGFLDEELTVVKRDSSFLVFSIKRGESVNTEIKR